MHLAPMLCVLTSVAVAAQDERPLHVLRAPGAVTVDGRLDEWVRVAGVSYEVDPRSQDRSVKTYAMYDDTNLYLAYVVRDRSPMRNAGDDPATAFKTGDSLHVYVGADPGAKADRTRGGPADYHVLMAELGGKPVVFGFRQVKPGVTQPTVIRSPATRIELAWMGPVPGATLAVDRPRGRPLYVAEVALPLAFFEGLKPRPGLAIQADVAVNFSNPGGTGNIAKVFWHRGSAQVLDIPTELAIEPYRWGRAVFQPAGYHPVIIDRDNCYVVPTPGKVTVDGDLGEWDLSCAYGPQYVDPTLKDRYNVTWAAMYDDAALYLGAVFNSAEAYRNTGGVNNIWWYGDSIEFRLAVNPKRQGGNLRENTDLISFGIWHNDEQGTDYICMQRSFRFKTGDTTGVTVRSRPTPTGRTFEVRVPWRVMNATDHASAGDAIRWTMSAIWRNGLRAYGMGSISSFRTTSNWGNARFLKTGRPTKVYRDIQPRGQTSARPIAFGRHKVKVRVPGKGTLSAGVYDQRGRLLRTLFSGRDVKPGALTIGWDGKTDDGKAAPKGTYEVRLVHNAGLRAQYVTSACSPGRPPHADPSPTRGWGGVWGNVVDVASDRTGLYLLWSMEEGDGGLIHADEDGRVLWRQHLPIAMPGPHRTLATNGRYVYVTVNVTGAKAGRTGLWRVSCKDGSYVRFRHAGSNPLEFYLDGVTDPSPPNPKRGHRPKRVRTPAASGMAADGRTLYVSAYYQNAVRCFDAESGAFVREIALDQPRGLCLDGRGGLVAVSARRVVRVDLKTGQATTVVGAGLVAPHDVAVDRDGTILVTDRGTSQQVKRLDADGRLTGTFGRAGGRALNGKYEVDRLRMPAGVTVAASGKVFFSEDAPPRVFVRLDRNLRYEKLWSGPWYLSGEVCVDPHEPTHLYMWSHEAFIRHVIDYKNKTYRPDAVWSEFALPIGQYGRWFPRVVHRGKRTYVFCGGNPVTLYRVDGDRMWIASAIGADRNAKDKAKLLWVFNDLDENGRCDPGETVHYASPVGAKRHSGSYWGGSIVEPDLTIYALEWAGRGHVFVLEPRFTKQGVPVYGFDRVRTIPLDQGHKARGRANLSSIWHATDGGVFGNADYPGRDPRGIGHSSHLSDTYIYRLDAKGDLVWRAGSKASGIAKPGEFYGRMCGLAGPVGVGLFSFVDENGQDKVYTTDGLFVGNLLADTATASPSPYTLFVEHFNSIVYRNRRNGRWYFVAGASGYASIWEIVGLDTITRLRATAGIK